MLLLSLSTIPVEMTDIYPAAKFHNCLIEDALFNGVSFEKADLRGSMFKNVRASYINFEKANLEGCTFDNCIWFESNFKSAVLPDSDLIKGHTITGLNVEKAIVATVDWLDKLKISQGCQVHKV